MIHFLSDFFHLIYPKICMGCNNSLIKGEYILCSHCLLQFPKTNFELSKNNPIFQIFKGRVNIETATAFVYFKKEGSIQSLLHQLKYKGKKEVGIYLGELFAQNIIIQQNNSLLDLLIPVPIHSKKLKIRGYNQSEIIAQGFSNCTSIPVNTHTLVRTTASESQTRKKRWSRWENVQEVFQIQNPDNLKYKHVLLIDDVITTGATLEACAAELLKIEGCKVSIAGVAFASN